MAEETKDPELQKILEGKFDKFVKKEEDELVRHLDSKTFDEFITKNKIAVVDFWAEWCAPCFILSPIIEELARDYPQIGFGKVNSDENPEISARYSVMSLPTVIFFKNGEPVDAVVGAVPREEIEEKLKALID